MLELYIVRVHASIAILSAPNVTMLITKETLELMEHRYVQAVNRILAMLICPYLLPHINRVTKAQKDHVVLKAHQDKRVTQVPKENPGMMATLVYLEVMAHLESVTIG